MAVAAAPAATRAGTVTFNDETGFDAGTSLVSHADWAGDGRLWQVVPRGGGDFAIQSSADDQTPYANNRFTPDAGFLNAPSTAARGTFRFAVDLRNDRPASADGFGIAHRIRVGGTDSEPIIQFEIFDNGVVQFNDGDRSVSVMRADGGRLDLDDLGDRFITLASVIDFASGTHRVTADGVPQTGADGNSDLRLRNTPDDFGQITLQWGASDSAPDHRRVSLDNLTITATDHANREPE